MDWKKGLSWVLLSPWRSRFFCCLVLEPLPLLLALLLVSISLDMIDSGSAGFKQERL